MCEDSKRATPVNVAHSNYDFYRCWECKRLTTKLEMDTACTPKGGGKLPCGHSKMQPTWPAFWEWARPNVIKFAWTRARGGG